MSLVQTIHNPRAGLVLRMVQVLFALLTFILAAVTVSKFFGGSFGFLVAVGLISLCCTISVILINLYQPHFLFPGAVLVVECICVLFNFIGFIASAADIGSISCSWFNGNWYASCAAGKAGVVFSAFNFLLYAISLVIFSIYAVHPLVTTSGAASLWKGSSSGSSFSTPVLILVTDEASKKEIGDSTRAKASESTNGDEETNMESGTRTVTTASAEAV